MQPSLTNPHPWKDFNPAAVCDSVVEMWQGIKEKVYVVTAEYHYAEEVRAISENIRAFYPAQASELGYRHFNKPLRRGLRITEVRLSDPVKDMGLINVRRR